MIVVDGNHLAYRILFANVRGINEGGWRYFRHLYLNSLISVANKFNDGKIIVAFDNKSWRKLIYPEYKAGREKGRDDSPIDFEEFFEFFNKFEQELSANLPLVTIQLKLAEADDIIAALAKNWEKDKFRYPGEEMIVVSSDKDLQQVKRFNPEIRVYDPIKKQFMKEGITKEQADHDFLLKVMLGDGSDNIPGIERGVGPARAAKILALPKHERHKWFRDNPERILRWDKNVKLMSFKQIPDVVIETSISKYEKSLTNRMKEDFLGYQVNVMELSMDAETYCKKNGLVNIGKKIGDLVDAYAAAIYRTRQECQLEEEETV